MELEVTQCPSLNQHIFVIVSVVTFQASFCFFKGTNGVKKEEGNDSIKGMFTTVDVIQGKFRKSFWTQQKLQSQIEEIGLVTNKTMV